MAIAAVHLPPLPFVCCWLFLSFPDLEPPSLIYFAVRKSAFCLFFFLVSFFALFSFLTTSTN